MAGVGKIPFLPALSLCLANFKRTSKFNRLSTPDHLFLDSAPNLGPLISRWKINKFENCWYKSARILEILKLLFQQFLNLSSSQRDLGGPILGALSNIRWSWGTYRYKCRAWVITERKNLRGSFFSASLKKDVRDRALALKNRVTRCTSAFLSCRERRFSVGRRHASSATRFATRNNDNDLANASLGAVAPGRGRERGEIFTRHFFYFLSDKELSSFILKEKKNWRQMHSSVEDWTRIYVSIFFFFQELYW